MQDQNIYQQPEGVQDILASLSRQIKAIAFGVAYASDEGMSHAHNALLGMSDLLHRVAAGIDDLAELPLPTLDELGDEARLVQVAYKRMQQRTAEDLYYRIRQLGSYQRVDLLNNLRDAFQKMNNVEQGLKELYVDDADEDLIAKVTALKGTSAEAVQTLEASLGELQRLNNQVAQILPIIKEVQNDEN